MGFNRFDFDSEVKSLLSLIFDTCKQARIDGYDGFREFGFEKIQSRYFSFVFLCGGDVRYFNSRAVLNDSLMKNKNIKIIISEKLDAYKGKLDLLTFESLLEAFSRMIIIPVESFGTACELGAFTRIDSENNKVVAILDTKHAHDPSFINNGPIQYLRRLSEERVIEATFIKQGEKTLLISNTRIANLIDNSLITNEIKIKKYFKNTDKGEKVIIDLSSFLIAVLDLICLLGFVNRKIVEDFFVLFCNNDSFEIKSPTVSCNHSLTMDLIDSLLNIYQDIGFLRKKGNVFIVASEMVLENVSKESRWIGNVLFTKKFSRSDEYLRIKAKCVDVLRKIERYGTN